MIKLFYTRAQAALVRDAAGVAGSCMQDAWRRDPLAHPALDAMSLVQLADLPAGALRSWCRE